MMEFLSVKRKHRMHDQTVEKGRIWVSRHRSVLILEVKPKKWQTYPNSRKTEAETKK